MLRFPLQAGVHFVSQAPFALVQLVLLRIYDIGVPIARSEPRCGQKNTPRGGGTLCLCLKLDTVKSRQRPLPSRQVKIIWAKSREFPQRLEVHYLQTMGVKRNQPPPP